MRITPTLVIAVFIGVQGIAAEAQPKTGVSVAEQSSSRQLALAARLVGLIHPDQVAIDANMRGWEKAMRALLAKDATFAKLEATYPGVSQAALDGARPVALEYSREFVGKVKVLKTKVFAERLTSEELQQAADFFVKPAGQKFARQMAEQADPSAVFADARARSENEKPELKVTDLAGETRKTAARAAESLSPSETVDLLRFGTLAAAKKFAAAGQEAEAQIVDLLNNTDPKWAERQQAALSQAALAFVDRKRAGK